MTPEQQKRVKMEAKELDRLLAAAELRNPQGFSAGRERYIIEISYMAGLKEGHDQCASCDTPLLHEGEVYKARKEVVEFIDDLIIGIDGCKFGERLDGDKGCIVLDMNENQWQAQKKSWGIND